MKGIKKIIEKRQEKKGLEKRLKKMEKEMATLQMAINIAIDSRLSYLETNFSELKRMKPQVDQMCEDLQFISKTLSPKERKLDDKSNIEIV